MNGPLVSLCVPTYNRADSLAVSLESICGQDYEPVEILISDNGSTDETERLCRRVAACDRRIRYFRQPCNGGVYQNHNFLLDASRGEFVCFFHDHDTRTSNIVSEYVGFMRQHPKTGVVCSDWDVINESGIALGVRRHEVATVTPGLDFIERTIRTGRSSVGAPGAMIRRAALGDVRFDEQGSLGFGDFVVWFRIAEQWSIGHVPQRLWGWRQEPNAQSVRRIVSLVNDYDINLTGYCDGHLTRWPDHQERVERWRRFIRRYIFWALAFEIGLHYKSQRVVDGGSQTLFEMLPYRLTPEEFDVATERMAVYRTGLDQSVALLILRTLVRLRCTWPLAWITRHYASMRVILGLR